MAAVFTVQGHAMINGIPADGLTCAAFLEERWFPSGTPSPVLNQALPGTPDASTVSGGTGGGLGTFLMNVPQSGSYWIACYQANAPAKIAWEKVLSHPHTAWQGWTAAASQLANRSIVTTTQNMIANYPQSTIQSGSTSGFLPSGYIFVQDESGLTPVVLVQYTGTTANSFTGCTGGTPANTIITGDFICQAFINGNYRRLVTVGISMITQATNDAVEADAYTTLGGSVIYAAALNQSNFWSSPYLLTTIQSMQLQVDPLGAYGIASTVPSGTKNISLAHWVEVDF